MRYLILFWSLSIHVIAFSQQEPRASILGAVTDSTYTPLPSVTIKLYKQNTLTQPIKTTITDSSGNFKLSDVDKGNYVLVCTYTGFIEKRQDIIVNDEQNISLDKIILTTSNKTLQNVTVTGRKQLIEQTNDKIIFNAEQDPATKTEMAIDILRKVPFVTVDGEDNVRVNGQTNFRVLLNGRETAMFAQNIKEALKGFPGSLVTKIEVITVPSAKYDGEGVGGIINIITKKKVVGYNGTISLLANSIRHKNGNVNLNAKFGKLGFTLFYSAGKTTNQLGRERSSTIPYVATIYNRRVLQGDANNSSFWNSGNAELNWELDTLNTISIYGNASGGNNTSRLDQTITTEFIDKPISTSYYNLNRTHEYPTFNVGADYIKKFRKNKEREFSIRMNKEFGDANTFLYSEQDNPGTDRFIINNSIARNTQYTIQADYIHPLKNKQKIEGGVKSIFRRASSDFRSLVKYASIADYKVNPANTNNFNYQQDVYSIYATYSFNVNKTTFNIGARMEHTQVNGDFMSSHTLVRQSYTNLLPSLQASKKINKNYTLVLLYNKRLQRPFIWNLNPFVNNNDSFNISFGNPNLNAQTIHNVSLQNRLLKGGTFIGFTFSGSYSKNMIVQYSNFDKITGITSTTSANLGK